MTQLLNLALLGYPQVWLGDTRLNLSTQKAQALLYFLVMNDRPYSRSALAGLLWGNLSEAAARRNLRVELSRLRQVLEANLITTRTSIAFNHQHPYKLDVAELNQVADDPLADIAQIEATIALYRGEFLEDLLIRDAPEFETWVLGQREHLRQMALSIRLNLIDRYQAETNPQAALTHAQHLLSLDPLREENHQTVMRLLAQTGQRSAALAQFTQCQQLLSEALNVTPSPATAALYEQIRTNKSTKTLPTAAPYPHTPTPPRSHTATPHLPTFPTSFVGREPEIKRITNLLNQVDCQLLSIVGPGGIGKTRLAIEAARPLANTFNDGVYYVTLVGIDHSDGLVAGIVEALPFSLSGSASPQQQLLAYLQNKHVLLLLDNFEHLLPSANFLLEVLEQTTHVKLLVTSRVALDVAEEWLLPLDGLPLTRESSSKNIGASQLFIERATRIHLNFVPTDEAEAIWRICQLMEGMPLGIELAAAWVRVLSCAEIVTEIERNLGFLDTELDLVPPHQRSLRAVFEQSWSLLSPDVQGVFSQMSIFRGGFSRDAAERVSGATLRMLSTLIDKSFLQRGSDGRYAIHELLRQFAAEKLSLAEQDSLKHRHANFFANFVHQRAIYLMRSGEPKALSDLAIDIENIQAGWEQSIKQVNQSADDIQTVQNYLPMLSQFYNRRGLPQIGITAFQSAIDHLSHQVSKANTSTGHSLLLAQLKVKLAGLYYNLSQYDQVIALISDNLLSQLKQQARDYQAEALSLLGMAYGRTAKYPMAKAHFQQSLALYEQLGIPDGIATARSGLALIHAYNDDYTQATQLCESALDIYEELGYERGIAQMLGNLGTMYARNGDVETAFGYYQRSFAMSQSVEDAYLIGSALSNIGSCYRTIGDFTQARTYLEEGLTVFKQIGEQRWTVATSNILGLVLVELGQHQAAITCLWAALTNALNIQALADALDSLPPLGRALIEVGQIDAGIITLYFSQNHQTTRGMAKDYAARFLADVSPDVTPEVMALLAEKAKPHTIDDIAEMIGGIINYEL